MDRRVPTLHALVGAALFLSSCSVNTGTGLHPRDSGAAADAPDGETVAGDDGGTQAGDDGSVDPGGGGCSQSSPDQSGCGCATGDGSRACYPASADPATRNVGACMDGMQACTSAGEFSAWGPCLGAITPTPEDCTDGVDNNCDGQADCLDPQCAGMAGCCTDGQMRPCYDGPAGTEGVGICHGGMQTCVNGQWQLTCAGEKTPEPEMCADNLDHSCDGLAGCLDPACVGSPSCGACQNGQTRPCYDGPAGTEGLGICHGGMQTCVNGQWQLTCAGEQTPQAEVCSDNLDHDCNGLPGCFDLFACLLAPVCMPMCTPDPGCVCPMGAGDQALCPDGYLGISNGGFFNPGVECCPCTANDCGNAGCCAEQVCLNDPQCAGYTCQPLPPMCNGMVNFDCDDFPEDCDEPCCKCAMCP